MTNKDNQNLPKFIRSMLIVQTLIHEREKVKEGREQFNPHHHHSKIKFDQHPDLNTTSNINKQKEPPNLANPPMIPHADATINIDSDTNVQTTFSSAQYQPEKQTPLDLQPKNPTASDQVSPQADQINTVYDSNDQLYDYSSYNQNQYYPTYPPPPYFPPDSYTSNQYNYPKDSYSSYPYDNYQYQKTLFH